ncbi:MAG TPA: hypothetical protein VNK46_15195 [Nitrospiraceae bacterium]|jgi:hypothetical protein|nr:hypothetical protein [Nitrospiraceae bacterium]
MKTILQIAILGLFVPMAGCGLVIPKETRYLELAQDRATQEDVRQELGDPQRMAVTQDGELVWVYEVRQLEPGSQNTWATTGSWCDEYTLRFDADGVLRQWTHKSFLHGGELMPLTCNTTVGVQKPAL